MYKNYNSLGFGKIPEHRQSVVIDSSSGSPSGTGSPTAGTVGCKSTWLTSLVLLLFLITGNVMTAQVTYYSKAAATNFSDVASWGTATDGTGAAPASISNADNFVIQNASAMTLNGNASVRQLTLNSGSLTVSANSLIVSKATGFDSTLALSGGTLTVSGGSVTVNGNFNLAAGGKLTQSGGSISVDGNNGGVASGSVASGTNIVNLAPSANADVVLSGGTFTVVDPHYTTNYALQVTAPTAGSINATGTHTFRFGDGVSTDNGGTNGFAYYSWNGTGIFNFRNLTLETVSGGTNRFVLVNGQFQNISVTGDLTINTGAELRNTYSGSAVTGGSYFAGNIINNGTLTNLNTVFLANVVSSGVTTLTATPVTNAQTISGTGVFRNLTASPTANFSSLSVNNSSTAGVTFSGAASLKSGTNTGTVSGTFTLTNGLINTGANAFVLGISGSTLGTFTYTAGGFGSGSTFGRWYGTSGSGTTITASTSPAIGSGSYPFVTGVPGSFALNHFHRATAALSAAGVMNVQFNGGSGTTALGASVTENSLTFDRKTNSNWVVTTSAGYASAAAHTFAVLGQGSYIATTANARLLLNEALVGTQQAGSNFPMAQRTAVPAANIAATYTIGSIAAESPVLSAQSGPWEDPMTWAGGAVPSCTNVAIMSTHNVTVSASTTATPNSLQINIGGTLTVTGGSITLGCTNNNATLSNSGTVSVSGGTVNINGNYVQNAGGTLSQSAGDINVDGNAAGVAANSVLTGTPLFQVTATAAANLNLTGGTITIVDPHAGASSSNDYAVRISQGTAANSANPLHNFVFGNGSSTDVGGHTNGFYAYLTQGSFQYSLGNVTVNAGSGTNRFVTTQANFSILGDLTVNAGSDFRAASSVYLKKNLINNGTVTTTGTLVFSDYTTGSSVANTVAQSVSGSGVFRNLAVSPTANYANITINNSSATGVTFSDANSLLNGANTGTVSGTLTLTTGYVNTGSNAFVLGVSTSSVGTLSYTAGGFASGSNFSRWWGAATGGATITAGATPTGTGVGVYPFAIGTAPTFTARNLYLNQTTAATTGGRITVSYGDVAGTSAASIVDGAYTVDTRSNGSWSVAQTGFTGTPAYSMAVNALGLYTAANGNSRITLAATPAAGTHQNGSTLPNAQRTAVPLANLADTYYIGVSSSDIPYTSIATGDWDEPSTWNKGSVPTCADTVFINNTHNVTVNSASNVSRAISINSGGTLTVDSGDLTIGCTLNNTTLTVAGTLTVTGGSLVLNGNFNLIAGGKLNQSGGTIAVDGNNAGNAANSVASGTIIVNLAPTANADINLTGGTFTIVDPHYTTTNTLQVSAPAIPGIAATGTHTFKFGDGVSTDAGGANGFAYYSWNGTGIFTFRNVVLETVSGGANRFLFMNGTYNNFAATGDVTINSGAEFRNGGSNSTTGANYFSGNIVNNGTFTSLVTVFLSNVAATGATTVSVSPATGAQTISGAGVFRNLTASPTASFPSLTVNNNNATGVTLNTPLSVSGTLTMTSGLINTTAVNILRLGTTTATGTLSGTPSTTNMIVGPFARTFPASRSASASYTVGGITHFPVGKGGIYSPVFVDPVTAASGPVIFSAEAFASNSGTMGSGVTSLSTRRYEAFATTGLANLTSANIRLSDATIVSSNKILQATSAAGAYGSILPSTTATAGVATTASPILAANYSGYFAFGDVVPCVVPADQPTALVFTNKTSSSFTPSYTAAASSPTGYLVVRYTGTYTITAPSNLTAYTVGNALGGRVDYVGSATTFTPGGTVAAGTTYDYVIYSYNNSGCAGPIYNLTTPLTASVTTCPTMAAPGTPASSLITTSGFTATWTASAAVGVDSYVIDVATNSGFTTFVPGYQALNVGNVVTKDITGLSDSSTYYIRVRGYDSVTQCFTNASATTTVNTLCAVGAVPYTENFNSVTTPALPLCTVVQNAGLGNTWTTAANPAANGFSSQVLRYGWNGTNEANTWFYTKALSLTAGTVYRLTYKYGNNDASTYTEKMNVAYGTAAVNTAMTLPLADHPSITGGTPSTNQIDFIPPTTGTYYIGFHAYSAANQFNLYLDDISVVLGPNCLVPTAVNISDLTNATANLNWTAPVVAPANGYDFYYSTSNTVPTVGTTPSGSVGAGVLTAGLSSLAASTPYFAWVRSACTGGEFSEWTSVVNFTTPCNPLTLPVNEGLNAASIACWSSSVIADFDTQDDVTPVLSYVTATTVHGTDFTTVYTPQEGTGFYKFNSYDCDIDDQIRLVSVPFSSTGIAHVDVNFKWLHTLTYTNVDEMQVQYSLDRVNWTNAGSPVVRYDGTSLGWAAKTITLPAAAGNKPFVYVAFVFKGAYGGDMYIDDIKINATPACAAPQNLTATGVYYDGATLNWNASVSAPANGYEYYYSTSSTAPTGVTTPSGAVGAGVVTDTISGLDGSTTYYFWVRSVCVAAGDWSNAGTFATTCDPISTYPWTEGFETTSTWLPCMDIIDGNSDGTYAWGIYTTFPRSGTRSAGMYTDGALTNNDYLIMPQMSLDNTAKRIKFWVRARSASEPEEFSVRISTTGTAIGDFGTVLLPSTPMASTTYVEYIVDLDDYVNEEVYIAFVRDSAPANGYYLYIDDVTVENIPTCFPPTALTTTALTSTTATISWTAPAAAPADGYEYYYSTSSTEPTVGTTISGSTLAGVTNAPLSLLTASTTYYFWVRSVCSGSDKSAWSSGGTFYTGYCISGGTTGTYHISNFETSAGLTNITNPSGAYSPSGYGDFTGQSVSQYPGTPVNFTATIAGSGTYGLAVFIDLNNDYDFNDPGETAYNSSAYLSSPIANSFSVPFVTAPGNYRMRVVVDFSATSPSACGSATYKEVEDYTFTVVAAPLCTGTPSAGTIPATFTTCSGNTQVLTSTGYTNGSGIELQWEESNDNGIGDAWAVVVGGSGGTTPSFTSPALSSSIYYRLKATCSDSGLSSYSNVSAITVNLCRYAVTRNTGITYSSIMSTGTTYTTLASGDDAATNVIALTGTTFRYMGEPVTGFYANTNGWMSFDTGTIISNGTNAWGNDLTNSSVKKVLAPFWEDLVVQGGVVANQNTSMRYKINGTLGSGSADIIIEWAEMERYQFGDPNINFQIVLHESNNSIEYNYGTMQLFNGATNNTSDGYPSYSVGLNGASPSTNSLDSRIIIQAANSSAIAATSQNDLRLSPDCSSQLVFMPNAAHSGGSLPSTVPVNNEPAGAITLSVNPDPCTQLCGNVYNSKNATATTGITVCGATTPGTPDDDVWFAFTADSVNAMHRFAVQPSTNYNAVFQILDANTMVPVACVNAAGAGLSEITTVSLTTGANYLLRVYDSASGAAGGTSGSGEFSVCINTVQAPPAYDEPAGAVTLTVGTSCTTTPSVPSEILRATATVGVQACGATTPGNADDDVWYKFTTAADATGIGYNVRIQGTSTYNPVLQLFAGTPSTGNSVTCINATGNGGLETYASTALLPSTDYYVRVYHSGGGAANGTFSICVFADVPTCIASPTSPVNASANCQSASATSLTWAAKASAVNYDVYFDAGAGPATTLVSANQTALTYSAGILAPGSYSWRVIPKNSFGTPTGCSDFTFTVDATTVGGSVTGGTTICGGSTAGDLTLSGHVGAILRWESSVSPFTTWTPIANTTTTHSPGAVLQTTQFRAVIQSGVCTIANSVATTITASSTTWTSGSWSNGVPNATTAAIIASNYTSATNLAGDVLTACSLTVNNNAVVVVSSGDDFNITGAVTVSPGSTLTFANNANLLQDPAGTTNSNSGSITSTRETLIRRLDYTYWSSPVAGQDLKLFSPYTVSPTNAPGVTTPVGTSRFYTLNEPTNAFAVIAEPLGVGFEAAKGYMLRAPNNFPANGTPTVFTGQFKGVPNNGNYSVAITNTAITGAGFNMLGNPYPSAMDATEFLETNPGTLYFWSPKQVGYSTYNTFGVTPIGSEFTPNGIIQTGQGFLLHAENGGTANFTNAMRSGNNQGQFFRGANVEKHRFWLHLSNAGTPVVNQILVGYMAGATEGFDVSVDGLLNHAGSSISSMIGAKGYAIQGRSLPFNVADVVPLAFNAATEGSYTLTLDQLDGLFAGDQDIFLKDNLTGAEQNLKAGAYTFASTAGSFSDRFSIVYQTTLGVENPTFDANTIVVYKDNGVLHINSGTTRMSSVKVFDIRGRLIYEKSGINATTTSLNDMRAEQQVLLVQITSDENRMVTKKVIN